MEDRGRTARSARYPRSSIFDPRLPRTRLYATIDTPPPGRFAETGVAIGPLCFRLLNQNAVNQTFVPAGSSLLNARSCTTLLVFPSNCHSVRSAGGFAPTNENRLAPL